MAASNSDYELLTEHFSYPPVSLLDDIINTVNVLADRALDSVERLLLSIPPKKLGFSKSSKQPDQNQNLSPEEAAKLEIENGTHQLETLLNASIDKNFDIFELYVMQNIITVRPQDQPYMRLSHYSGLDFPDDDTAAAQQIDKPSPESITALRRRLQASQKLNAVLEAEKARNDALLKTLRSLLGVVPDATKTEEKESSNGESGGSAAAAHPFTFLRDRGGLEESGGQQPITTTTEFTLSQLQALRALSGSLRELLPGLGDASVTDAEAASAAASWRRERAEYIETSSRKYLETVVGLELGPEGEVRDGEWQGEGRGLSKGEVEGLEKVAAMLGGGRDGGGGDAMDTT
ncbi:mis12 protein domain-containing protein [Trichoderma breve]|uniref:Mis12 protein domain-containing protein n=1 Tax=Trichoderma breve TaxID=2034170 RepID=A0A9W9E385_9HYPO|nr:mis12 protein domain-containing protein [Trichoderma breve]KAJ4855380.1 mis12 protein domain-containing protein [Trichoderma breve]